MTTDRSCVADGSARACAEPLPHAVGRHPSRRVLPAGELAVHHDAASLHRVPLHGEGRRFGYRPGLAIVVAVLGLTTGGPGAALAGTPPFAASASVRPRPSTVERITQLEAATAKAPTDGAAWLQLGSTYLRRGFETADPAFYPLAERSLTAAQRILGPTAEVRSAQANLALARHRFGDAQELASAVVRANPARIDARLALFDATIELGDYQKSASLIQGLVDERPSVATLSRLSYSRQLAGDLRGAEIAMRQAVSAAPPESLDQSVALGYLGDVLLEGGHLDAAARSYDSAAKITPSLGTAIIGQARIAAAKGDLTKAAGLLDQLVSRLPLPGALGLSADLARANRSTSAVTAADQLVDASVALFESNGAVVDAELAIMLADRGRSSADAALRSAKRAYAERRTIFTNDAMAWSLFVAGRAKEAVPFARAAVTTDPGTSSVRWHAAAVFAATGDLVAARRELTAALRNPWSSPLQTAALQRLARQLGVTTPMLSRPSTPKGL